MFKELTVFSIAEPESLDIDAFEQGLHAAQFVPANAQQERSLGWVCPRGHEYGRMVESIGGHWLAAFRIETRAVPGAAVKARVAEVATAFEKSEGRKPGRKAMCDIKEGARMELMTKAFSRIETIWVWVDPKARTVAIGTTVQAKLDDIASGVSRGVNGLTLLDLNETPRTVSAMRHWLTLGDSESMPEGFVLGTECVLRAESSDKATARFTNQNLDCNEVRQNVLAGKAPLALELCWGETLSLVLTAGGRLKKIRLNTLPNAAGQREGVDELDADFALFAAELSAALSQLRTEIGATSQRLAEAAGESARAIKGIASMWQVRHPAGEAAPFEA